MGIFCLFESWIALLGWSILHGQGKIYVHTAVGSEKAESLTFKRYCSQVNNKTSVNPSHQHNEMEKIVSLLSFSCAILEIEADFYMHVIKLNITALD